MVVVAVAVGWFDTNVKRNVLAARFLSVAFQEDVRNDPKKVVGFQDECHLAHKHSKS